MIDTLLRLHVRLHERVFYFRIDCRHNDIAMGTTGNVSQAGNNSELSGNDSTVYLGRASLVARSGIIMTTKLIVSLFTHRSDCNINHNFQDSIMSTRYRNGLDSKLS